jgi:hypothetical protein
MKNKMEKKELDDKIDYIIEMKKLIDINEMMVEKANENR